MNMLEREPGTRYLADANRRRPSDRGLLLLGSADGRSLYAENLPHKFFDLSSGDAGVILQKLRTYHVRLAVVAPKERVVPTSRFSEMAAEERRSGQFALFETREAAAAWLATGEHEIIRD